MSEEQTREDDRRAEMLDQLITDDEPDDGAGAEEVQETEVVEPDDTAHDEEEADSDEEATPDSGQADTDPPDDKQQQIDELHEQYRKAVETLTNAANRYRNTPSEQNLEAAAKAKEKVSKIDALLSQPDEDFDALESTRTVASEVKSIREELSADKIQELIDRRVQERLAEHSTIESQARHARNKFEQENGVSFTDYEAEVRKELDYLDGKVSDDVWADAVRRVTPGIVERLKGSNAEPESKKSEAEVKTPKATKPIKSKSGQSAKPDPTSHKLKEVMESFITED